MKPAPCTYPLRWQCDRSLAALAPPEPVDLRSSRGPGMNHFGSFEPGTRDTPSQSPAILVVAGARRFRALPTLSAELNSLPSNHWSASPPGRKSASPKVLPYAARSIRNPATCAHCRTNCNGQLGGAALALLRICTMVLVFALTSMVSTERVAKSSIQRCRNDQIDERAWTHADA